MEKCPDCESEQSFLLRKRPHGDSTNVIEIYISCTTCLFEQVLRLSTYDIENLRRREAKLSASAEQQVRKHGAVAAMTERSLFKIRRQLRDAEFELRTRDRTN